MKEKRNNINIDYALIRDEIDIKDVLNVLGIEVNKSGFFLCPAHTDKKPSASIKNNRWKCFSCESGGTCIDLVMHVMGTSTRDAAVWLGTQYNIGLSSATGENGLPKLKIDERINISASILERIGLKENPFRLHHKEGEHYLLLTKKEAAELVRSKCEECIDSEHEFCIKALNRYPVLKENGMASVLLEQTRVNLAPIRDLMSKMDAICNEELHIKENDPLGLDEEKGEER